MYVILDLKCMLFASDVSQDRNVSTNFSKNLKYEISGNSNRHKPRHSMRTDFRHEDSETRFSQFQNSCANPPKKIMAIIYILKGKAIPLQAWTGP